METLAYWTRMLCFTHLLLLLFGAVYLPSAETVLDLLLRHSENTSKLICSKQPLWPLP